MRRIPWPRSKLGGAAARLLTVLAGASAIVLVVSVAIGLLAHGSLNRAISLGFYLVGAFLAVGGFMGGSRGSFRSMPQSEGSLRFGRRIRRATAEELNEAMSVAAVAIVVGIALLAIGIAIDRRYALI